MIGQWNTLEPERLSLELGRVEKSLVYASGHGSLAIAVSESEHKHGVRLPRWGSRTSF